VLEAVAPDGQVEPLGQRVDDRDADAVEAARHLVAAAVAELAAGVKDRQHDLGGRLLLLLHDVDGDAAAVVGHRDTVVGVDDDLDLGRLARKRLVDRVVHHLVDQVVQTALARRSDVHPGPLSNGLETLQDGDVLGGIRAVALRAVLLCRLLRQIVLSIARRPAAAPPYTAKSPDSGTPVGRVGALHKTALDTSRLPPAPDASERYKMPANRDKPAPLTNGSVPNRRRSATSSRTTLPRRPRGPRAGPARAARAPAPRRPIHTRP
jgi:hypothetical protein